MLLHGQGRAKIINDAMLRKCDFTYEVFAYSQENKIINKLSIRQHHVVISVKGTIVD